MARAPARVSAARIRANKDKVASYLGAGIIGGGGVTPPVALPAFVYQVETEALVATFTTAPTRRRKRSIDAAIKRLKDGGVWSKIIGFWRVGADQQSTLKNWKTPGIYDLTIVGAPTFSADKQMYGGSATAYLETGILASALDPNSHTFAVYAEAGGPLGTSDMGAVNGSGVGITLSLNSNTNNVPAIRSASAAVNNGVGVAADWTEGGFYGFTRRDANNVQPFHGPVNRGQVALASTGAMAALNIRLLGTNANGASHNQSLRAASAWCVAAGLTDTEMAVLAETMQQLHVSISQGSFDTYDAGFDAAEVTADVVIYGATSIAVTAAYEAKRQGLSVAICGGWRDRHIGGMSAGGLGQTDWRAGASTIGGLPGYLFKQLQTLGGKTGNDINFEPRNFELLCRRLLDPKNAEGRDVQVYWSDGVDTVQKVGKRITAFRTADGRTFKARYFLDASYENDLAWKAGLSVTKGREAAGSGQEAFNGYRGLLTTFGGTEHQFKNKAGTLVNIDPYVTAGNAASGLLAGLRSLTGAPAVGAADDEMQAYNFRMTTTNSRARRVPFPSTPPTGYDKANYEALGRLFAADNTLTFSDVVLNLNIPVATLGDGSLIFDINAKGGFSIDKFGLSKTYPAASYADRETNWKAHENFIRGFIYYLQYETDARIPASVRTSALNLGLDMFHYSRPHPNDAPHWMPQLYVREAWRLVGDYVHNANDIAGTDASAPRSAKTIAVASYWMDSHHVAAYADPNGGTPRIWNEGNFFSDAAGGTDLISPVPYEAILPKAVECENLASLFGVSSTHAAFGTIRMEITAMMLGQAAAVAAKVAVQNGDQALQAVDYPTLRTALLATPTLANEPAPNLPQVN